MAEYKLLLPAMGESVDEATVTQWLKNEGDVIAADDAVVEIATDKVDSEVNFSKNLLKKTKLFVLESHWQLSKQMKIFPKN